MLFPGTVAFLADLNQYTSIPVGAVVLFDSVRLNIGNGCVQITIVVIYRKT